MADSPDGPMFASVAAALSLFAAFCCIARRRVVQSEEEERARHATRAAAAARARGLSPAELDAMEAPIAAGDEIECCAVCLERAGEGDAGVRLNCGHQYHAACARGWLAASTRCPLCKADARAPAGP